eukprot:CAMPEP_0175805306 /NCGR_PEP_ID=MMETSP0107_2-20121207/584_1 /TAXON_ID=195067 ORGANISM="Goniomonas pacifica, Strain CCMP1869" /NCGR_SAMPLE_ID=MMETSP0107_2 /ASSEMBLY_ACC=CAM_ASM_000203 /LENGTH=148 /DNA_ID=CAMNT_0017116715 /DNA_START=413 /DNA_END=857 /DNA_ORIENTATION=+
MPFMHLGGAVSEEDPTILTISLLNGTPDMKVQLQHAIEAQILQKVEREIEVNGEFDVLLQTGGTREFVSLRLEPQRASGSVHGGRGVLTSVPIDIRRASLATPTPNKLLTKPQPSRLNWRRALLMSVSQAKEDTMALDAETQQRTESA